MSNKGQSAKSSGHLVILLSVIGLVAFSSAMKDLSQLHRFALDASSLVAWWSHKVEPVEITPSVVRVETCELNRTLEQSIPSVELPWLGDVAEEKIEIKDIETPAFAGRSRRTRVRVVRPVRPPRVDFDPVQLEVRVPSEHDADFVTPSDFPQFSFKTRTRKPNVIRISPRDREMILKTLNRSINLRIAS
jgi:hypothetical protein